MQSKPTLVLAILAISLLLNSCKKADIIKALNEGKDCQAFYQAEKKMKKIITTSSSGTTKTAEFSYTNNVITGIRVTYSTTAQEEDYAIAYASGICLPSGYNYRLNSETKQYNLDGAFTINNTVVVKRVITPDYRDIYTADSSSSDVYGYDTAGRVDYDLPGYAGAPLYDAVLNVHYDATGNVARYVQGGGDPQGITTNEMDAQNNPFQQQNHLFFLMKFLPFITIPHEEESVYYFFTLNMNNPLKVRYSSGFGVEYEYTFEYTYTADGYPATMKIYRADAVSSTVFPRQLQEELVITY